ncbi:Rad59p KNAG_0D04350 [Huiozyma naganishii CBS 8797]|uniref:DNA repair protein RAD59 n=1 Tax=Huiozyma naganishii (strain ATCC MYA-139 / BCRC 22969 / CBS 8797 / KCTC 17520 / NBRC 10181 / NCYC 3082 / Yp74L-3) TaxID=1071383 RepID=J7S789_HUIN7|nr:hypothetical protein KNAG_0D04350 [Kazachstania naganishii CBS 8797]CCK70181.1 hypothetical protein KNAG_0D04350 [Kazachstania naganishii CBS 8797]
MQSNISYASTAYSASSSTISIKDLSPVEDWSSRPVSDWSVQKLGVLQGKIEQYTYKIYHNSRYGKVNLSRVIPGHVLRNFANECFGFDGWEMEILDIEATQCVKIPANTATIPDDAGDTGDGDDNCQYMVVAEASVKITLQDGTNTQRGGMSKSIMQSKGNCYQKVKKEAVTDAFKNAMLSFGDILEEYNSKVKQNYYVDGLYVNKIKTESDASI